MVVGSERVGGDMSSSESHQSALLKGCLGSFFLWVESSSSSEEDEDGEDGGTWGFGELVSVGELGTLQRVKDHESLNR